MVQCTAFAVFVQALLYKGHTYAAVHVDIQLSKALIRLASWV